MITPVDISNTNKKLYVAIEPYGMETINLTESDIQNSNSLSLSNKAVSGSNFEFGAVYAGECIFAFKSDLDRYKLYGAKVVVSCGNGTDTVEQGVYYVSDAVRTGSCIAITAYDGMMSLNKSVEDSIAGTVYELLAFTAEKCGISLGQSKEEIDRLPNAGYVYSAQSDCVSQYRDLVSYLAKLTCTFATFDRRGNLKLGRFHEQVDTEIGKNSRSSPEMADYEVYYEALRVRFPVNGVYKLYRKTNGENDNREYDFGDIPIVNLLEDTKKQILDNLFMQVQKIRYVPVSSSVRFNPFLELGDRVSFSETNHKGDKVETYVMSYEWSFRRRTKIKSVGSNPYMATVESKEDKQLALLESSVSAQKITIYSYVNAKEVVLESQKEEILTFCYAAEYDTNILFFATIPFIMDLDGSVEFSYYLDNVLQEADTVRQYFPKGEHFVTLSNHFPIEQNKRNTLTVKARTEYTECDSRIFAGKLIALEEYFTSGIYEPITDNTPPQAVIPKGGINAVLCGQGLAGERDWDGTLHFAEPFSRQSILLPIRDFQNKMAATMEMPTKNHVVESVESLRWLVPIIGMTAECDYQKEEQDDKNTRNYGKEK